MIKPISPDEIGTSKARFIPSEILEAFNELIALNYCDGSARVGQDEVMSLILQKFNISSDDAEIRAKRREIFDRGYLNVEEVYRDAGWKVEYDKPAYNESYEAFFLFKSKRR